MSASVLRREAAGVVSAITAYNYPLLLLARKVGGALAAGCAEVVVPSPRAPVSTIALLRELEHTDIPPGVINLVVGGINVAKELTTNSAVDVVSFTGSLEVGREVMAQAATGVKKVVLELGGKSPNIVLPGTDLSEAVGPSSLRFMLNTGQGCGATTRTLVPTSDYADWVEASREFFGTVKVGDPRDPATDVGPLVGAAHRDRVQGYVDRALARGAVLEANAESPSDRGFFIDPMLVGSVDNSDEISQEELFGPVGVVIPFDDVDQALELAHQTRFGLNANIWGPVPEAIRLARRLRSGTVTINGGGGMRQDVPWGGMGASGVGREAGEEGFNEYLEVKHIQWPLGETTKPFGAE
jgi:aldehyde dehydrogenase (NAD+)